MQNRVFTITMHTMMVFVPLSIQNANHQAEPVQQHQQNLLKIQKASNYNMLNLHTQQALPLATTLVKMKSEPNALKDVTQAFLKNAQAEGAKNKLPHAYDWIKTLDLSQAQIPT